MAAAAISYLGPFTGPYRAKLLTGWQTKIKELEVPLSETFSVVNTLGNPVSIRDWNLNGLPTDTVSIDNSIFATKGYRWPLMIDP